ncbi:hypothetical protein CHS0354_029443 [Potamilus streckersoni]|uniref:Uncharacterized protein n=1 Tax=Potamilus streckersoni TaxID=2493646 RepID=A0AAE0SUM5_9BIVA|nr:hypothetical protein CHS0354_029443 [Potamilus streckersoni]
MHKPGPGPTRKEAVPNPFQDNSALHKPLDALHQIVPDFGVRMMSNILLNTDPSPNENKGFEKNDVFKPCTMSFSAKRLSIYCKECEWILSDQSYYGELFYLRVHCHQTPANVHLNGEQISESGQRLCSVWYERLPEV